MHMHCRHSEKSRYFVVIVILLSCHLRICFLSPTVPSSVPASGLPWYLLTGTFSHLDSQRDSPEDIQEEAPHPWGISPLSPLALGSNMRCQAGRFS